MTRRINMESRNLELKVQLRRRVLEESKFETYRVLDLCAGDGEVWRSMRQRVKIDDYVPVGESPQLPGAIAGDLHDERFLSAFDCSRFNVIDIDIHGEPWKPWAFLRERISSAAAVFLTHGTVYTPGGCDVSKFVLEQLGIPLSWKIPMKRELSEFAASYMLLGGKAGGARISKGWKISMPNATYYGLLCEPRKGKISHG